MQVNFSVPLSQAGEYRGQDIPTNIIPLISKTSWSEDCFIRQQFSAKLQTYLVNYVLHTNSFYDINV